MINSKLSTLLFISIATASVIQAAPSPKAVERFSLGTSLGVLNGTSKEFVYDEETSEKISQLDWQINGAPVIRAEANYKILDWVDLNAQGWIALAKSRGTMDDFDWLVPGQADWSDWSHHDDSPLRQANEFDLGLRAWFVQKPNYQLAALFGYQRTLFSFKAIGGCFFYDNGEEVGCFNFGEPVIGYKQIFKSPYIGLGGKYLINLFEFNGLFKISNQVRAEDVDQHYLRQLTFTESNSNARYYNVVLNAGYYVKPQIKLFAEGSYTRFPNKKASGFVRDNETGETDFFPIGAAGLQNKNLVVALGIQYKVLN